MRAVVRPSSYVPPRFCVAGLPVTRAASGVSACPTSPLRTPVCIRTRARALYSLLLLIRVAKE